MKRTVTALVAGVLVLGAVGAHAQKATPTAERGLIGINLFDPGVRVVSVYGTPDEIQPVNIGAGGAPAGGGGGFPGAPGGSSFGGGGGGKMGGMGAGGMGGGRPAINDDRSNFDFGTSLLFQTPGAAGFEPGPAGGGQNAGRFPGAGGPPSGFPGAGGPGGGFPGAGGGNSRGFGGASEVATFTRWVYNRNGSKYGFIIDKFNRVVQIEAIGLQNAKVRTRKGIGFGNTFAQVIKAYQVPDGYEISGDQVLVKFLTRAKVAFRLSRLGANKPQVVTGIVVAAGKG